MIHLRMLSFTCALDFYSYVIVTFYSSATTANITAAKYTWSFVEYTAARQYANAKARWWNCKPKQGTETTECAGDPATVDEQFTCCWSWRGSYGKCWNLSIHYFGVVGNMFSPYSCYIKIFYLIHYFSLFLLLRFKLILKGSCNLSRRRVVRYTFNILSTVLFAFNIQFSKKYRMVPYFQHCPYS